jgi:hypothetical protein
MARKILVDFVEHGSAQAGIAYYHDWMQSVGTGAQRTTLH